jgi:hypothetical protein
MAAQPSPLNHPSFLASLQLNPHYAPTATKNLPSPHQLTRVQ